MTCSSLSPAVMSPAVTSLAGPTRAPHHKEQCNDDTLAYTLSDSRVMLRRNLKHQLRYPSMTLMLVGMPVVLLLLFVYVFGGQLGAGLGAHLGRHAYLDYVVPGVLLITVASAVQGTSIMVAMDMTGGIIDRFRTMAIARASVLTGHVLGSLIQILVGMAVLIGVAFGLGFHSSAGLREWLAAIGSWPCSRSR